jgi:predicted TIM-barrel fold metal-dependent hydrolase
MITGACDCHLHIVGPLDRYPQVPERTYTAPSAHLDRLQAAAGPHGVTRFVIAQASFYGTDNSCMLDALDALGNCGRGVAVVEPQAITPELLDAYASRGIRGLRVNLYSTVMLADAAKPDEFLNSMIAALAEHGDSNWHVEILSPLAKLVRVAPIIAASPVPVVLDHYGLPGGSSPDSAEGRCLMELARLPHVWVKRSGPYRIRPNALETVPPVEWLTAILEAAPDRCVWGSDWPHTPPEAQQRAGGKPVAYRELDYGRVLGDFLAALPDAALAQRILVDNPVRLYGFPQ